METEELINETVEEILLSGNWCCPDGMTEDEFENEVKKIVEKHTLLHYDNDDSGIDDYEHWEQDIIIDLQNLFDE